MIVNDNPVVAPPGTNPEAPQINPSPAESPKKADKPGKQQQPKISRSWGHPKYQ